MSDSDLEPWQKIQRQLDEEENRRKNSKSYLATQRKLKSGIDLEYQFSTGLIRLIAKTNEEVPLISAYKRTDLDENTRNELRTKVKMAMASPKETGAYELMIGFNQSEASALEYVKYEGLIVLGLLEEKGIIPDLITWLRGYLAQEHPRMRMVAGAVLRYLTGQDIGDYFLTEEEYIDQWEEWWEQNKSSFEDG